MIMRLMYIFFIFCFCSCNSSLFNRPDLECRVEVTRDYVSFDHCYNGLLINELEVKDVSINLYPKLYKKISGFQLLPIDSTSSPTSQGLKIYFNSLNNSFRWQEYDCADYASKDCYLSGGNYEVKDSVSFFQPNTWYLFDFFNPHFELFVHCDSSGNVSFVKKDLNANF
ncbi:MAG: hypothetical protein BGO54_12150 [Sphingobacteriales bacterium 46-32]|nr:MAG: hypothetical protein BGO54_12150 [Sphingobacteriales bacterium 46-32]